VQSNVGFWLTGSRDVTVRVDCISVRALPTKSWVTIVGVS